MGKAVEQKSKGDRPSDKEDVNPSRALKTLKATGLRRATDVYSYIVDTLHDHGEHTISVKEVNTNLTGTRQLLSTVQTVHRLQREAGIVSNSAQLSEFSQTSAILEQPGDLRKKG